MSVDALPLAKKRRYMKIILKKDDGTEEEIKHFILIAMSVGYPPFRGKRIFNISKSYVPDILSDHARWQRNIQDY